MDKKIPRVTWYREITPKMAKTKIKGNIKLTATLSENTESKKLELKMQAQHPDGKVSDFPLNGKRGIEDKDNIPLEDYNLVVESMDDFMDNLQDGLPKFLFEVADKSTNKQEFGKPSGVTMNKSKSKLTLNKLSIDTTDKTNEEILDEIKKEVPDIPQRVLDTILNDLQEGNSHSHSTSVIDTDVVKDLKNAFESIGKSKSDRITSILPEDEKKLDELEKLAEADKNKADKLTREKALIKKYGKAKIAKLAKKMHYKLGK